MTRDGVEALELLRKYPAQYGRMLGFSRLTDGLHGEWIKKMTFGKGDYTLQAHRGSYKTTCDEISIAETIMLQWWSNTIFLRKTDTDVAEVVNAVDKILRHKVTQELYRAIFQKPLDIYKSTGTEITTSSYTVRSGAPQLLGIGIGGSLTGKHADIIRTDDIVNLKDRKSRAEREQTKAIYQELQNVKNQNNPESRIINTGTPWHKEDAFTLMPEPEKWDCYRTGMLGKEKLEEIRMRMSPSLFAANYELRHIAVENALFTTAPQFFSETNMLRDGIAHIDAAYGGEDYTAFTCGKRIGDKLYMYGKMWHSHVDTVLDACVEKAKELMCAPILCEDNGDKGFLAKEIMKQYKARTYHEKENKYMKISSYLRKWWENIVWLEGTDREYLAQIMDYTEDAEHDDAPDSAAVMCRYYDRRSGEEYQSALFRR